MKPWRAGLIPPGLTLVERKYDGLQVTLSREDALGRGRNSFTGERTRYPRRPLPGVPPGFVVLGEAWLEAEPATAVLTALKAGVRRVRFTAWQVLETPEGPWEELSTRKHVLLLKRLGLETPHVVSYKALDEVDALRFLQAAAWEGLVYRHKRCVYDTYKLKPVRTCDLQVVDVKEGSAGKFAGTLGSLVCARRDGTVVANVSGMTDEVRAQLFTSWRAGMVVEVAYDSVAAGGRLRFPRLVRVREDKELADEQVD